MNAALATPLSGYDPKGKWRRAVQLRVLPTTLLIKLVNLNMLRTRPQNGFSPHPSSYQGLFQLKVSCPSVTLNAPLLVSPVLNL